MNKDDQDDQIDSPVDVLRLYALGRLPEFSAVYKPLTGKNVLFAVAGVRAFRRFPGGIGLGPYEGCAVIKFAAPLGTTLDATLAGLQTERLSGVTVYVASVEREGSLRARPDYITFFVARPEADMLLVATDRVSLRALVGGRQRPEIRRKFMAGMPEWKLVDLSAPAWAIRHYRRSRLRDAGTETKSGPREGTDPGAIGVVYNAQPASASQIVYYASLGQQAPETALLNWEWQGEGLESQVHRKAEGVVEINVATPSAQETSTFSLLLLYNLGFQIGL